MRERGAAERDEGGTTRGTSDPSIHRRGSQRLHACGGVKKNAQLSLPSSEERETSRAPARPRVRCWPNDPNGRTVRL